MSLDLVRQLDSISLTYHCLGNQQYFDYIGHYAQLISYFDICTSTHFPLRHSDDSRQEVFLLKPTDNSHDNRTISIIIDGEFLYAYTTP